MNSVPYLYFAYSCPGHAYSCHIFSMFSFSSLELPHCIVSYQYRSFSHAQNSNFLFVLNFLDNRISIFVFPLQL